MVIYYLLAIAAAFLQPLFGRLNLPLALLLISAARENQPGRVYVLAFMTGLLTDFLTGGRVGFWAVAYLLIIFLLLLFKLRFPLNWRYLFWFFLGGQLLSYYVWPIGI